MFFPNQILIFQKAFQFNFLPFGDSANKLTQPLFYYNLLASHLLSRLMFNFPFSSYFLALFEHTGKQKFGRTV